MDPTVATSRQHSEGFLNGAGDDSAVNWAAPGDRDPVCDFFGRSDVYLPPGCVLPANANAIPQASTFL